MKTIIIRAILTWFLFIPVAISNGITREKLYKPIVGDLPAHQISTVIASVAFIVLTYYMLGRKLMNLNNLQLFLIGLMWVVMTIAFEFGFGHYLDGQSWQKLFLDYNLFKGHVWGLFLLVVLVSPFLGKLLKNYWK